MANPGFASGQTDRYLNHPTNTQLTRAEDEQKRGENVCKWQATLNGMLEGSLNVGAACPTEAPRWVTLEVLQGGFASGKYLADLALEEENMRARDEGTNGWWLSGPGQARLSAMLDSGCFRVRVPEHAALLVVTWLLRNGHGDEARAVLDELAPWMERLRFFPDAAETPVDVSPETQVMTTGELAAQLKESLHIMRSVAVPRVRRIMAMEKACADWRPLKWRLLALFGDTLECQHAPLFVNGGARGTDGKAVYAVHESCAKHNAQNGCGWPLQRFASDWKERAAALLADVRALVKREKAELATWHNTYYYNGDTLNAKRMRKGSTKDMFDVLTVCVEKGVEAVPARKVALLRNVLAGANTKYGLPGTDQFDEYRTRIEAAVPVNRAPYFSLVIDRLNQFGDSGLALGEIESVLMPDAELGDIPKNLCKKVERTRRATVSDLLEAGLVGSGEVLAVLVPALTSQAATASIEDASLRRVFFALRMAFSKRRSLLLLNLERQTKMDDLPWAQPLVRRCTHGASSRDAARMVLDVVVRETLTHFPQTILPNKLIQSLRDLSTAAGIKVALTEELAADIFMGRFSAKFAVAAEAASRVLSNTVYSTYYGLGSYFARAASANESDFTAECFKLAGVAQSSRGYSFDVPENGRVIEQGQILSSHSLAGLYEALDLDVRLDGRALACKTWTWIVRSCLALPRTPSWRARLQTAKNVAFAWRQLLFFISTTSADPDAFLQTLADDAAKETGGGPTLARLQDIFLQPLRRAVHGEAPEAPVLGWVSGKHVLLQ